MADLYAAPLTATAALVCNVSTVLLAILATVPTTTFELFVITLPTTSSVRNNVPVPVTVALDVIAFNVPVALIFVVAGDPDIICADFLGRFTGSIVNVVPQSSVDIIN
jgi:hypothetical protein